MAASALAHLECSKCGRKLNADVVQQLCHCGSPLMARYDLEMARASLTKSALARRPPDLWRFGELLPVRNPASVISLGERITPLLSVPSVGAAIGIEQLFVKDEGQLPTGTFKARGAAVGLSRARELGVGAFAMPTNGNAGGAWAAYGARAGIKAHIFMPRSAPDINRVECEMAGAQVRLVDGLIGDAAREAATLIADRGLYDASTLKEPYRIEGKKTIGFELAEQFDWNLPDVIIFPTGGGVGVIGIYKALRELQGIGLIGERLPRLVAVQSTGCAPIVRAWNERARESVPWEGASTIAFGINVPKALGDFLVLDALYGTEGGAIAVEDNGIVLAQKELASAEGLFVCLEGAATLAAAKALRTSGWIRADQRVVLINTGSGLKR